MTINNTFIESHRPISSVGTNFFKYLQPQTALTLGKVCLVAWIVFTLLACTCPYFICPHISDSPPRNPFLSLSMKIAFYVNKIFADYLGWAMSQYNLTYMYYYGLGIDKNNQKTCEYLQKSADQNYAPAIKLIKALDGIGKNLQLATALDRHKSKGGH